MKHHPGEEKLLAFVESEVDGEEAERIREHLDDCEECRFLVSDLEAFGDLEVPSDGYRVSDEELGHSLGALRGVALINANRGSSADDAGRPPVPSIGLSPPDRTRLPGRRLESSRSRTLARWGPWAAAAAALVLIVGWGLDRHGRLAEVQTALAAKDSELALLRERLATLPRPRAVAEPVRLVLSDVRVRGDWPSSARADSSEPLRVVLRPSRELAEETEYRVEIHDRRSGEKRLVEGLLSVSQGGQLGEIVISPGFLPPGRHDVVLYDSRTGQRRAEGFPLRID